MKFHPRIYQALIRNFGLENRRGNVFAGMGMGKTSASIDTIATLRMFGESRHALVLAPKRVALNTWPDEIQKWRDSFGDLTIRAAIGTPEQRIDALKAKPAITTINYDNLEWLIHTLGDSWYFDTVIADESPRLKGLRVWTRQHKTGSESLAGQGSVRSRALSKVAHTKVRRWLNLTGSPMPNGLQDLWGQCWFVDGGARLGRDFGAFEDRWFRKRPSGDYGYDIEPLAFAEEQIKNAIKDICITIDAKDYFDIHDVIEREIKIKLPPNTRKQYKQMEDELFTEIEGHGVAVFASSAKATKCLQIANGAVWIDRKQGHWERAHDEKLDALRSIVEETNGAPLLIRYCSVPDCERILKAFPKFRFLDASEQTVRDFQDGKIAGLVTHAASAGHGLSLQDNCWILVDYSTDYNLEHDEQIIERVGPMRQMQSGHTERRVFRYRILAEDTLEDTVCLPVVRKKATLQQAFKDAMKRRG